MNMHLIGRFERGFSNFQTYESESEDSLIFCFSSLELWINCSKLATKVINTDIMRIGWALSPLYQSCMTFDIGVTFLVNVI